LADRPVLAQEDLSLPQLADDLFRRMALSAHVVLPPLVQDPWSSPTLSYKLGQFSGGRSHASGSTLCPSCNRVCLGEALFFCAIVPFFCPRPLQRLLVHWKGEGSREEDSIFAAVKTGRGL
jgi:hypothetical protein